MYHKLDPSNLNNKIRWGEGGFHVTPLALLVLFKYINRCDYVKPTKLTNIPSCEIKEMRFPVFRKSRLAHMYFQISFRDRRVFLNKRNSAFERYECYALSCISERLLNLNAIIHWS